MKHSTAQNFQYIFMRNIYKKIIKNGRFCNSRESKKTMKYNQASELFRFVFQTITFEAPACVMGF